MNLGPLVLNAKSGIFLGFFVTLLFGLLLDKFGDVMFRKGVAKPFYIGRHRLHHRHFLLVFIPLAYSLVATMILEGLVKVEWAFLWTGLEGTLLVGMACMSFDLAMDYVRGSLGRGILKHELIYLVIPAFAFSDFLKLAI